MIFKIAPYDERKTKKNKKKKRKHNELFKTHLPLVSISVYI